MPFPQSPYYVQVTKAQVASADVSGAQYRLENTTKATEALKSSSESDSNITINLAECGDWAINDNIKITASYYGKVVSDTHQVVSGDNSTHDFGTLALADASTGGGTLVNGGLVS
jgi:hypothetical protein